MRSVLLFVVLNHRSAGVEPAPLCCGWVRDETLSLPSAPIRFSLWMKDTRIAEIKRIALAVADPASVRYGDFLSAPQIASLTAPNEHDVAVITEWLTGSVTSFRVNGNRIDASATLAQAELLFQTQFALLVNQVTGQRVPRASSYILPDNIVARVQAVFGLHGLPLPPAQSRRHQLESVAEVTPSVLREVMNVSGVTIDPTSTNVQAVAEFQGQTMSESDLADFFVKFVQNYTVGRDDVVSKYVGDHDTQSGQTEASLDIQYIMGLTGRAAHAFLF